MRQVQGQRKVFHRSTVAALAALMLGIAAPSAQATLTLTAAGISDGFTLSTVVSGFYGGYGPLGEAILPDGNFITGSYSTDKLYIFKDHDGQTLSDAVSAIPYTYATGNPQFVMATVGGQAYGAQVAGGTFVQFANDGTMTPIPGLTGVASYYGMWGDPANGHLIASSNHGLIEIDPVAGSYRVINSSVFPDGVTVTPDGKTIYAEVGGNIASYSVATGALLNVYSGGGHGPDGTGVISGGHLSGDVVVNNNDGTVTLIDPVANTETLIANGGTRGDFVSADTNNGTLFLSQYEQIARLSCGTNCSIGVPVPEPGTIAMMMLGLGVCGAIARRRRG